MTRGEIAIAVIALAVLAMTGFHLYEHHPPADRSPVAAATPAPTPTPEPVQRLPWLRSDIPCARQWQLLRGLFYAAESMPPDTNFRQMIRDIERASARAWSCEWGLDPPPTPVPPPRPTPEGKYG